MRFFSAKLAAIALVLWVGSLWAIGFIAAPTLFSALESRQLAGMLAGKMFTWTAYVGMVCGFYLLIYRLMVEGTHAFKQGFFWIAFLMLGITLVGHFGVQPVIESLKMQGGAKEVLESMTANRFARWHGIASILYLIQSVLGLVLVFKSKLT